ncbi:hypothetical protein AVEN_241823-1 [Araneus ventricosus]|uniref:Uncharacterized protein n=1 Tax=Araneus ventricosus TaxID=182803 RepID=A0A4Y2WPQ5_ARAVE|nr:hypothetical protein AVEN_241823-1 [Araneus ventricosus]
MLPVFIAKYVFGDNQERKRKKSLKESQVNVHDESCSDRPSTSTDDLIQEVDTQILVNRILTISNLTCRLPQFSRPVFPEDVAQNLRCVINGFINS